MAQPVNQFTIKGYGFQGLNTEMSPIGSDPSYALKADNCVIDRVGRISSREAFKRDIDTKAGVFSGVSTDVTAVSADYSYAGAGKHLNPHPVCTVLSGTYYPESMPVSRSTWNGVEQTNKREMNPGEFYEYDLGYEKDGEIAKCTYPASDNAGLERSIYVRFKEDLFLFSRGNSFLKYNGNGGWEDVPYTPPLNFDGVPIVGAIDGDIAVSAYGRMWVSGVNGDYQTIHYSSLLREDQWYDARSPVFDDQNIEQDQVPPFDSQNTGGIINVAEYWPVDFDQIVNIHAHNGFLIVFGRRSILVYANADKSDPAGADGIFLQDAISNVGLVERDAICNTGTDVMFCDDTGLRSLGRVIQEKSSPVAEPSMNIKREFMDMIQA
mgnify:CR=1 FL=1